MNTQFAVDHVAFNTGGGNGDGTHKKITFDNAPTEPTPAGTVSNVFPLLVGTAQELFFKNGSTEYSGSGKIQLTGPAAIPANNTTIKGYVTLPGGLLFQWINVSIGGSSQTENWSKAFTADNTVFAVTLGPQQNTTFFVSSINKTNITITRSGSGGSACWVMGIGV